LDEPARRWWRNRADEAFDEGGQQFELVDHRNARGEDRVYHRDRQGRLCRLPAGWTDTVEPAPLVVLGAGRAVLRLDDMVALVELLEMISGGERLSRKRRRKCRRLGCPIRRVTVATISNRITRGDGFHRPS
jgi:hypothetical protein